VQTGSSRYVSYVYFALLNTAIPAVIFIVIILSFVPHDMMYGPQAALIAECFAPRLRYIVASLGFHLSSVIAGGPAPMIATALFAATHSGYSVAVYIFMTAVVSIATTAFLPDYTNRDISQEHGYGSVPAEALAPRTGSSSLPEREVIRARFRPAQPAAGPGREPAQRPFLDLAGDRTRVANRFTEAAASKP
jgi:hypothetical protein